MIGDRRVVITTLKAGVGYLLYRRMAVAPFGVHLQVPAVLLQRGTRKCGIREDAPDFGAAEEVPPKLASPLDVYAAVAPVDRLFDGRRLAVSRSSRMTRVDPGPIPEIRGKAPSGPTRSVKGRSRARIAAAARL